VDLVRLRNGQEVERLSLGKFFPGYSNLAVIPGRQYRDSDDHSLERHDFSALRTDLDKRPLTKILDFADYDHDGQATEFFIQTEPESCGHRNGIVIGVSKSNPHLTYCAHLRVIKRKTQKADKDLHATWLAWCFKYVSARPFAKVRRAVENVPLIKSLVAIFMPMMLRQSGDGVQAGTVGNTFPRFPSSRLFCMG
jgi:hypothetical protein